MTEDSHKLLNCIKTFDPHFAIKKLDYFTYFASVNLHWSDEKILSIVDNLVMENKIKIENNIVNINKEAK